MGEGQPKRAAPIRQQHARQALLTESSTEQILWNSVEVAKREQERKFEVRALPGMICTLPVYVILTWMQVHCFLGKQTKK